jgi:hypothetical protein
MIELNNKQRILKTKLLYKYDKINKVNFHQYVDNHPNIILLIRTASGRLVGGFS